MEYDFREAMKLENQLCFPLYAAARKITGLYAPHLKPLELTYTQYIVMLVLWEEREITVGELCRRLHLDSGTISPLLKKLEAAGYVVKARAKEDERVVEIRLTETGAALQEAAKDIPRKVGSCVRLTPEKAGALYALLYEILGGEIEA
jgi:DNA-binding MarR family transcriptional regulator